MRKPVAILREMQMIKTNGNINELQRKQIIGELQKELDFVLQQTSLPLDNPNPTSAVKSAK